MSVYVTNRRNRTPDRTKRSGVTVYIGRPGIFGNPKKDGSRSEQVEFYRKYFCDRIATSASFLKAVGDLVDIAFVTDLYLECWCAPEPCHGDVVKEYIDKAVRTRRGK